MGKFSNYSEKKCLDHVLKVASFSQPAGLYAALFTSDPGEAGSGDEVANANGYARKVVSVWDAASARNKKNTNQISFDQLSGDCGTASHWGIYDSGTWGAGNLLAYGQLQDLKVLKSGNVPTIPAQGIVITIDTGKMSTYLANKMLDHFFGGAAYTPATHIKLAFSTADPTNDGSGLAEPSGNNYSRTTVDAWDACHATAGNSQNTNLITSPVASGSWGTISHTALLDDAGTPNLLLFGAMSPSQAVGNGDWIEFPIGTFVISID